MEIAAAIALGFAGGFVGGLLGVGGGILFVPALAIVLDHSQIEAVATSLVAIVPVALVGAWRQHGYGNVRLADGLWIAALAPPGVAAGVVLSNAVSQRVLEVSFAVLLLIVAARLLARALSGTGTGTATPPPGPRARP
jgi:uncharacterized membrane protein YfcA